MEQTRPLMMIICSCVVVVLAAPAAAAEPATGDAGEVDTAQEAPTVGLGVKMLVARAGMPATEFGGLAGLGGLRAPSSGSGLLIPMRFGDNLRVEPHVSFGLSSTSWTQDVGGDTTEQNGDGWALDAGLAAHHLWSPFDSTLGYVGLHAGLGYAKVTSEHESQDGSTSEYESDTRSLYAGPVVGGEYQPTETFGFGVEASLSMRYSTNSNGQAQQTARDSSSLRVGSHASIVARVYLW